MRRVRLHLPKIKFKKFIAAKLAILILIFGAFLLYGLKYSSKIYPNINIAGLNLSNKNIQEASDYLSQNIKAPEKITLTYQNQNIDIKTKDIGFSYDFQASANRAHDYTRTGNIILDWTNRLKLIYSPINFGLITKFDEERLSKVISIIAGQNSTEPVKPSIKLVNGKIEVNKGTAGSEVDQIELRNLIGYNLSFRIDKNIENKNIEIPVNKVDESLTDIGALLVKSRAEKFIGKKISITFDAQAFVYANFDYSGQDLINFINPLGGFYDDKITDQITIIAKKINRDPQNPKFSFENGKVTEFLPALDGIVLDNVALKSKISDALNNSEKNEEKIITIEVPVTKTPPEVTTDKINNLGIKELIGRGTSTYYHSIPGRIYNVSLAASRINGILVKSGETFSFNDSLGDVSAFTGYQQAYIISEGKTILGDGGGVCQVSTTLFRALLNAGLPINERTAHAYRVGYYEQNSPPGLDATVYGPSPDLKFTNDTSNYVLIVATADPKHYSLIFELYGTSDGRRATISKPIVSNITPALPTVYQDDPTLPAGKLKQVDYSAAGARVTFNYVVERNGETIFKKTFVSNYRPWAAVFLRGTSQSN